LHDKKLWKELIRLLSDEGQPAKLVLAQTCMGVFFIRYVTGTIFAMLFLLEPPEDRRGPQCEKHCYKVYVKYPCRFKLPDWGWVCNIRSEYQPPHPSESTLAYYQAQVTSFAVLSA
jgi:hypothetical protein